MLSLAKLGLQSVRELPRLLVLLCDLLVSMLASHLADFGMRLEREPAVRTRLSMLILPEHVGRISAAPRTLQLLTQQTSLLAGRVVDHVIDDGPQIIRRLTSRPRLAPTLGYAGGVAPSLSVARVLRSAAARSRPRIARCAR